MKLLYTESEYWVHILDHYCLFWLVTAFKWSQVGKGLSQHLLCLKVQLKIQGPNLGPSVHKAGELPLRFSPHQKLSTILQKLFLHKLHWKTCCF